MVGVGLSDGPKTPEMTGLMLEAQSFRRALDDAGLETSDIEGLASAGYGGMHEVMLAEAEQLGEPGEDDLARLLEAWRAGDQIGTETPWLPVPDR